MLFLRQWLEPYDNHLRYSQCQPLRHMKNSPKLAILQSLDAMDQVQMEKVLDYIKGLIQTPGNVNYQAFKKEAMKEIRKALRKSKKAEALILA
jgi:DNA-directed RNA polymerase